MFIEDDMWDRPANSVLIVSMGAGDQKKKGNSQKLGVKNNSKKEKLLLFVEDDMRVPWVSSLPNVSKAAGDQKKKEIAKNQRVKKNKKNKL